MILMALNPDKQRKAQAEIDSVIGCDVVRIQDKARLPYVRALILCLDGDDGFYFGILFIVKLWKIVM